MAQNSVNYSNNPTGPELLDDYLDKEQENILTSNSGIQRPSYADVGTKWLDTSSTPWKLMIFDGTSDVMIGSVNPVTHAFIPAGIDTAVLLTGNQSIGGTKTFTVSPQVPTASVGDSSSNVANTAFVTSANSNLQTQINTKANSSDVVNLTGTQTITGPKTFTGYNRIVAIQNSTVTYNTAPSSDTYTDISFRDKNGYEMGVLEHARLPNNDTVIRLAPKGADGDWSIPLTVGRNIYGTSYTLAPACDLDNSIVTTVSKMKAASGYLKLGNDFIIQWGSITGSGNYNFYIPFTTGSSISLIGADGTGVNDNNAIIGLNRTGFTAVIYGSGGAYWIATGF